MGACQHILYIDEKDCCDKAKENGMDKTLPVFNNCNIYNKIIPYLPDDTYPTTFQFSEHY